jgi:inhibitor of KinA
MLGFAPGTPYLGGLDARLAVPRRASPRTRVEAGSVGIANGQCVIYPRATPGGWRLIGRTPLQLFDAGRDPPVLLQAGDQVRFVAISEDEFRQRAGGGG